MNLEYLPFAKFLEWWSYNSSHSNNTVPSNPHISQVSPYNAVRMDYGLENKDVTCFNYLQVLS